MKQQVNDRTSSEPHSDVKWKNHEQTADTGITQAQQLVQETGSPELAKQAIDAVAESSSLEQETDQQTALAKSLGYRCYSDLLEASEKVRSNDGLQWHLTSLDGGTWAAWNDVQLHLDRHYNCRNEALANVPHDAEFSGSSLLG